MKTMAISEFKTHVLRILDQLAHNPETIIITKRGKPLAQVTPFVDKTTVATPGKLADMLVFEEDIVSPLGEDMWDAAT
ncbi:MAG: type II toxin-antitoxin system Phd/YefM family antitoxin [Chloroflexota bacterium]